MTMQKISITKCRWVAADLYRLLSEVSELRAEVEALEVGREVGPVSRNASAQNSEQGALEGSPARAR